jgi:DNA polymerase-3 subunit gamma/tau
VTADTLREGWDGVLETLKARPKGRVAWMVLGNASVVSLDEGVLTLRFPRQGDVKGFQTGRYEDTLKEVLHARFGVNVAIRAISGADPSGRRSEGAQRAAVPPVPSGLTSERAQRAAGPPVPSGLRTVGAPANARRGKTAREGGPEASEQAERAESTEPEVRTSVPDAPFPSDDDFDPDDEDMTAAASVELTGMALVQRELGGQIIGEFED